MVCRDDVSIRNIIISFLYSGLYKLLYLTSYRDWSRTVNLILKDNNKYNFYTILKQGYLLFLNFNYNFNFNFQILKQVLHQLQAILSAIQRYMI
jgi:hypothetical protein